MVGLAKAHSNNRKYLNACVKAAEVSTLRLVDGLVSPLSNNLTIARVEKCCYRGNLNTHHKESTVHYV